MGRQLGASPRVRVEGAQASATRISDTRRLQPYALLLETTPQLTDSRPPPPRPPRPREVSLSRRSACAGCVTASDSFPAVCCGARATHAANHAPLEVSMGRASRLAPCPHRTFSSVPFPCRLYSRRHRYLLPGSNRGAEGLPRPAAKSRRSQRVYFPLVTSHFFTLLTSHFPILISHVPRPTSHFPLPTPHFSDPTSTSPLSTRHFTTHHQGLRSLPSPRSPTSGAF